MSVVPATMDLSGHHPLIWYRTEPRSLAGIRLLARWLAPLSSLFKRA